MSRYILKAIDVHGFDWQIFVVAGSGIFAASYSFSSFSLITPSLAFIYWPEDISTTHATQIRSVTLAGVVIGALITYLVDRVGRRKLYRHGLYLILLGTIGMVQASAGFNSSMSILGWILFWRLILGMGIGVQYSSAAVLTTE